VHLNRTTPLTLTAALVSITLLAGCVDSGTTRPDTGSAGKVNLTSLVGMRAQNLDSEMNSRGFSNVGGYKTATSSMTTWWNPAAHQCVSVETREGRVASMENIVEGNCQ
jgi:hypothetical protein